MPADSSGNAGSEKCSGELRDEIRVQATDKSSRLATPASVNGDGRSMLRDKIDAFRIIEVMARDVQIRLCPAPPRAEAVEAEGIPRNLGRDLRSVGLDAPAMGRKQHRHRGLATDNRSIEVLALAMSCEERSKAGELRAHGSRALQ